MSQAAMRLRRFELPGIVGQARELHRVAEGAKERLKVERPGTYERYSTFLNSLRSIRRVVNAPNITGFEVIELGRKGSVARGIATAIHNHTITQVDLPETVVGTELDYWHDGTLDEEKEAAVVAELLRYGAHVALANSLGYIESSDGKKMRIAFNDAYAAVQPYDARKLRAFGSAMRFVGEPSALIVAPSDAYGISQDYAPLQILVSHDPVVA